MTSSLWKFITQNNFGETEIVYESLTAQDLLAKYKFSMRLIFQILVALKNDRHWIRQHIWSSRSASSCGRYQKRTLLSFSKLKKFVNSDEGIPCVNIIEKVYLGLLIVVFGLGILSLFRLSHFKAELLKVFDSRQGFTLFLDNRNRVLMNL